MNAIIEITTYGLLVLACLGLAGLSMLVAVNLIGDAVSAVRHFFAGVRATSSRVETLKLRIAVLEADAAAYAHVQGAAEILIQFNRVDIASLRRCIDVLELQATAGNDRD